MRSPPFFFTILLYYRGDTQSFSYRIFMHIGINGRFLAHSYTGIGQVTRFGLEAILHSVGAAHTWTVYTTVPSTDERLTWLQSYPTVTVQLVRSRWTRADRIERYLWEAYALPAAVEADSCEAFLSLYQAPTRLPESIRHTMLVHDVIPVMPQYRDFYGWKDALYQTSVVRGIRSASRVAAVSEWSKGALEALNLRDPSEVISVAHPSVNSVFHTPVTDIAIELLRSKYQLPSAYLYHGGGFERRKNAESVLRGYAAYRARCQERSVTALPLVLSGKFHQGNPNATDVEGLLVDLQLKDFVCVLGEVANSDLPQLYTGARLFIYPSLAEGFGLPVLEALCVGTPVLAPATTALPEVGGQVVVYLTDPTDVNEIAEKVFAIVHEDKYRQEKSELLIQAEKFTWENFAKKIITALGV